LGSTARVSRLAALWRRQWLTFVRIAEEDRRAVQETLYLTSIPGKRDSVLRGLRTPLEKCAKELDW
jgi:hypothetical protein